jgi:hypothetical protein
MPPRKKQKRSSPKFRGIRVLDTAVDFYQADAFTTMIMGQGLYGSFLQPFISADTYAKYKAHSQDGALDIRELAAGLMGEWKAGTGGRYSGGGAAWFGEGYADGPAAVILNNVQKNAIPTVFKVVGSNMAKKLLRKSGATRSLNRLTRNLGLSSVVRF